MALRAIKTEVMGFAAAASNIANLAPDLTCDFDAVGIQPVYLNSQDTIAVVLDRQPTPYAFVWSPAWSVLRNGGQIFFARAGKRISLYDVDNHAFVSDQQSLGGLAGETAIFEITFFRDESRD